MGIYNKYHIKAIQEKDWGSDSKSAKRAKRNYAKQKVKNILKHDLCQSLN